MEDSKRIQELVIGPGESLSVELKSWFDPDQPEGIAKIVKTAIALRNHGGGYIVIGFDNGGNPDSKNIPPDVRATFHIDKIQSTISKYASETFGVEVHFPERESQEYPVISIPPGVKTPVAAKAHLLDTNGNPLIKIDTVYMRSLLANNTPSTTQASWKDWPKVVETCFDNREADIGRFLRRHLGGLTPDLVRGIVSSISQGIQPIQPTEEVLKKYLQESEARYESVVRERGVKFPDHGTWQVGLILNGQIPTHSADRQFLNLLDSSNPNYTGWPVWLDSRGLEESSRPYVFEGAWEALIVSLGSIFGDQIEFMRLDPHGKFYLRRVLEDDTRRHPMGLQPLTVLEFGLPVLRAAEVMAVGIAFAKAMGCDPEKTQLEFGFKWTKLRGRQMGSWAHPGRFVHGYYAYQDEVLSFVCVPLETPLSALSDYVNQAVRPLFEIFEGFVLSKAVIEDFTRRLIDRNL